MSLKDINKHLTHFIYVYVASSIWLRTTEIMRKPAAATSWATLSNQQQGIFYKHNPMVFTLVVQHWLEQEVA